MTDETKTEGQEDELDSLLNEAEQKPEPKPEAKPEASKAERDEIEAARAEIAQFNQQRATERRQQAISETISSAVEAHEHLKSYDRDVVDGAWLKIAGRDQKVYEAFTKKDEDPETWKKYEEQIANELAEKLPARSTNKATQTRQTREATRGVTHEDPGEEKKTLTTAEVTAGLRKGLTPTELIRQNQT